MSKWERRVEMFWTVAKYALALVLIVAGFTEIMVLPAAPMGGAMGWVYSNSWIMGFYGLTSMVAGGVLLYGKIMRSRNYTGLGLLLAYLSFTFAAFLGMAALGPTTYLAWLPNALAAILSGGLFLRWKFKTSYLDPQHFREDVYGMTDGPPSTRYKDYRRWR